VRIKEAEQSGYICRFGRGGYFTALSKLKAYIVV